MKKTSFLTLSKAKEIIDQIPTPSQDPGSWDEEQLLAETTAFFDFVRRNEGAFRVLLRDTTSNGFASRLIDFLRSKYAKPSEGDKVSLYASLYMANGTVGMLREWVNSDFPVSSREIAEMMYYLSVKVN